MTTAAVANEAIVRVRSGPLASVVLGRVVGMLAARAHCPVDRLDDAILLTDAVAAHAPPHSANNHLEVTVVASSDGLELRVGALARDGAERLLADGDLPGIGNVFARIADEVEAIPSPGGDPDALSLRLAFRP